MMLKLVSALVAQEMRIDLLLITTRCKLLEALYPAIHRIDAAYARGVKGRDQVASGASRCIGVAANKKPGRKPGLSR